MIIDVIEQKNCNSCEHWIGMKLNHCHVKDCTRLGTAKACWKYFRRAVTDDNWTEVKWKEGDDPILKRFLG